MITVGAVEKKTTGFYIVIIKQHLNNQLKCFFSFKCFIPAQKYLLQSKLD